MLRLDVQELAEAIRQLKAGAVILFPTETTYGIGCDDTNAAAVARVVAIKARSREKGLPLILPPEAEPEMYVKLSPRAKELAAEYWPGPLNIIAPRQPTTPVAALCERHGEQSVRKSSDPIAAALARGLGQPLVATSANPSGGDPTYDSRRLPRMFGRKNAPDFYLDAGVLQRSPASTTVRLSGDKLAVLRQGGVRLDLSLDNEAGW